MTEIWKDVLGYEGLYEVSNIGRVRSIARYNERSKKFYPSKIKSIEISNNGYLRVKLSKNGKKKGVCVHRLVAEAFLDNSNKLPQVDHIDGDKNNNCVENLRWVTAKQNIQNPNTIIKHQGKNNPFFGKTHTEKTKQLMRVKRPTMKGGKNPSARKIVNLSTGEIFETLKEANEKYGLSRSAIGNAIRRKTKSAGFYWDYC